MCVSGETKVEAKARSPQPARVRGMVLIAPKSLVHDSKPDELRLGKVKSSSRRMEA